MPWCCRTYCVRGRWLQYDATRNSGLEHGLALFSQLVCNKIFLLSFIRTLEQRSDFIVRDRVNVASLISVALHTRLDYLTELVAFHSGPIVSWNPCVQTSPSPAQRSLKDPRPRGRTTVMNLPRRSFKLSLTTFEVTFYFGQITRRQSVKTVALRSVRRHLLKQFMLLLSLNCEKRVQW